MSAIIDTGQEFPIVGLSNGYLFLKVNGFSDGLYVYFSGQWLKIGKVSASPVSKVDVITNVISGASSTTPTSSDNVTFGGNF